MNPLRALWRGLLDFRGTRVRKVSLPEIVVDATPPKVKPPKAEDCDEYPGRSGMQPQTICGFPIRFVDWDEPSDPSKPPVIFGPPPNLSGPYPEDAERTRSLIRSQSLEIGRTTAFVTCGGGCGRRIDACRGGFRCRQCGVVFCWSCSLDHFELEVDPETRRVRRKG